MTKNVIAKWVAERAVSANGMHEIREGAVNERERPLVGYAATYEQARSIADTHNNSAAVAELHRLALLIDEECGNSKPNFGRVVHLAADAGFFARVQGA